MLLSAVSVLVVAQSSSEIPEGLMNNPVYTYIIILYNTTGKSHLEVTKNCLTKERLSRRTLLHGFS